MKKYDVTAIGELLVDFIQNGQSAQGHPLYEANPGGAPCNVLSMLAGLGRSAAFIGKVGDDAFGHMLKAAAEDVGIDCRGLSIDSEVHTTLAFVSNGTGGERSFAFYRNPGADMMLSVRDVDLSIVENSRVLHFGTLSSTSPCCREATRVAISRAEESGCILSFDPNLRERLWDSLDSAAEEIVYGLRHCDILKIADNEFEFLAERDPELKRRITGSPDLTLRYGDALMYFADEYGIRLACLTLGASGSLAVCGEAAAYVPAVITDRTVDTTGAGDCFCACMINSVLENGYPENKEQMMNMLEFATAASSIVTTRKGALSVMPGADEIMRLQNA